MVADVDAEHVRFALFSAAPEATEQPPAGEHVGQGIVLGEVERVPGGQDVDQCAEADATRVLGQHRVQQHDVRHHLEPVALEVVLGRPHRVVPERVAVLGIGEEVRIGPTIVVLAVVPPVGRRPVDAGVRHVHSSVEKGTEMHRSLQSPGEGERRGPCLPRRIRRPLAMPYRAETSGWVERDPPCTRYCATARSGMHLLEEASQKAHSTRSGNQTPRD